MIIPAYGPKWRNKIPKMAPFLWHIQAIHYPRFRTIQVAPYNKPPRPKRRAGRSAR